MKKVYQIGYHYFEKSKIEFYELYFKTELEATDYMKDKQWIQDNEVMFVLPCYVTEKRYKWIFNEI